MGAHKTVTPKQLAANRTNARKSTGPKSQSGKRRSCLNAVKHGILSSQVVVKHGMVKEDEAEFEALLQGLRTHWQPVGQLEDLLVQEMAGYFWRLGRVFRSEVGQIEQRSLFVQRNHRGYAPLIFEGKPLWERIKQLDNVSADLLLGVKDLIEHAGLSPERLQDITAISPDLQPHVRAAIERLEKSRTEKKNDQDEARSALQNLLTESSCRVEEQRAQLAEIEEEYKASLLRAISLPAPQDMDRLLRYETAVQRRLDRVMTQLQRLQERRKGAASDGMGSE